MSKHEKNSVQFSCQYTGCSYSTPLARSLKIHGRIHEVDPLVRRPLACHFPNCGFRTSFSASLKGRGLARHGTQREKRFSCALCQHKFYDKHSLELHIHYLHTKEQGYACEKCPYTTYRRHDLQIHRRRVDGEGLPVEKKFKCDYRAFQEFHLNVHMMTKHTEERQLKFEHPGCNFMTNYNQAYKKHLLSHEDTLEAQLSFTRSFPNRDFRRRAKAKMMAHERQHEMGNSDGMNSGANCIQRGATQTPSPCFFHKTVNHIQRPYNCSLCDYAVSCKQYLENYHPAAAQHC